MDTLLIVLGLVGLILSFTVRFLKERQFATLRNPFTDVVLSRILTPGLGFKLPWEAVDVVFDAGFREFRIPDILITKDNFPFETEIYVQWKIPTLDKNRKPPRDRNGRLRLAMLRMQLTEEEIEASKFGATEATGKNIGVTQEKIETGKLGATGKNIRAAVRTLSTDFVKARTRTDLWENLMKVNSDFAKDVVNRLIPTVKGKSEQWLSEEDAPLEEAFFVDIRRVSFESLQPSKEAQKAMAEASGIILQKEFEPVWTQLTIKQTRKLAKALHIDEKLALETLQLRRKEAEKKITETKHIWGLTPAIEKMVEQVVARFAQRIITGGG